MAQKTAKYGVMLALAMIMGYIEYLLPFNFGIPGIKLGLANIVAMWLLYIDGFVPAISVNILRILLCGILFGNALSIIYSLAGGILSVLVMALIKRLPFFSEKGVSTAGGIVHNIGQLTAAGIVLKTAAVVYYLPALLISGAVTGLIIGLISSATVRKIKE